MIVMTRSGDSYPDDADPARRYRLPLALRAIPANDGVPQAAVSRSADGGLLHLRLGLVWPAFAAGETAVPLRDGRFRLRLHGPSIEETGEWRTATVAGEAAIDRSISLSPAEVAIARHLGRQTGDVVDVDVELMIRGRAPSAPWLASVRWAALQPRLAALLGSTAVPWARVEAAVLGLDEATFTWHPLVPGALPLPRDAAMRAIAFGMAPFVLSETAAGWTLRGDVAERVDVRLDAPREVSETIGLRWSFTEFLSSQPDPGRHLVDVAVPEPFTAAEISVFNDLPLSNDGLRSIAVEFKTGGPTGRVRHEFLPGQPGAVRLRFVRETVEPLALEWTAKATIVTAQGPAIHAVDGRRGGLLLDLNSESLGITPIRCAARPEVFAHVRAIDVVLGARTLTLTLASPEAWAVGRRPPETADLTAVLPSGERVALGRVPLGPNGVEITAAILGLGDIVDVPVTYPDAQRDRVAYLAVQVEGHGWHTLDAAQRLAIPVRRDNRFTPPRLRYRTRHVARDEGGRTAVIAESPWRDHARPTLDISV